MSFYDTEPTKRRCNEKNVYVFKMDDKKKPCRFRNLAFYEAVRTVNSIRYTCRKAFKRYGLVDNDFAMFGYGVNNK